MSVYLSEAKEWRFIVSDLTGKTITLLDTIASERTLNFTLNAPAQFDCRVPSDDPRVNILFTDDQPYVEEGIRLVYGFRREDTTTQWICRFGGILEQLEDATRTEDAQTHLTAYDPWQYLFTRFCRARGHTGPTLIGGKPYTYTKAQPATIVLQQLAMASGNAYNNPTPDLTSFHLDIGTFETDLPLVNHAIEQGTSLGQMMTDLAQSGDCDITITPVWDPVFRPGVVGEINLYAKAGSYKPTAVFSWDKPGRSLVQVSKLKDGTRRANKIVYLGGQGGAPTGFANNTTSQATYGIYEDEQFFPDQIDPKLYPFLQGVAANEVALRKDGAITVSVGPAPARAPRPFQDYYIGDWAPMIWSDRLREESILVQRVVGMPVNLSDDGVETVNELLVIVSEIDQPPGFAGGTYLAGTAGVDPAIEAAGLSQNARAAARGTTVGFIRPFRRAR